MSELILLAEPLRLLFGAVLTAALVTSFAHIQYLRRTTTGVRPQALRRAKQAS